jgi:hypothetical protein
VVHITLSLNGTRDGSTPWFGIGIHSPSAAQGGMIDADMVIVQPVAQRDAGGAGAVLEVAEYWGDAYARPTLKLDVGAGSGLSLCAAEVASGGGARVTFTRPLRGAPGGRSQDVVAGERASVAWALGGGPTLAQHRAAGRAAVTW